MGCGGMDTPKLSVAWRRQKKRQKKKLRQKNNRKRKVKKCLQNKSLYGIIKHGHCESGGRKI